MTTVLSGPAGIHPDAVYPVEQLRHFKIGESTLRRWRRAGMKTMYCGRVAYVSGREILRMLEKHSDAERWDSSPAATAD